MKVLVACEESQVVCIAFRERGHEAYSCDIIPCSGGHPEWHLQMDVLEVINLKEWDLMIAHPECTRLTCAANKYYKPEYRNRFPFILEERESAVHFFMLLVNADIKHRQDLIFASFRRIIFRQIAL